MPAKNKKGNKGKKTQEVQEEEAPKVTSEVIDDVQDNTAAEKAAAEKAAAEKAAAEKAAAEKAAAEKAAAEKAAAEKAAAEKAAAEKAAAEKAAAEKAAAEKAAAEKAAAEKARAEKAAAENADPCANLRPSNPQYVESRPDWKNYLCLLATPAGDSGENLVVCGEWDGWQKHVPLVLDNETHSWRLLIPKPGVSQSKLGEHAPLPLRNVTSTVIEGIDFLPLVNHEYQFKFISYGNNWHTVDNIPKCRDNSGNENNKCALGSLWGW